MKSNFLFILLSFSFFFSSLVYGQSLMYSTSISSTQGQNYSVDITLELTGIVVAQNSCQYGYNYDVDYNYTIQFNGNSPSSLNTLQGTLDCGSNQGIFFNLPLTQGSGSATTTGNPWNPNANCSTATVNSLACNTINLQIQGSGIPNQTVVLTPGTTNVTTKWDRHGNQADTSDFFGTTNAAPIKMKTNNVERMTITENGNIGFGVSQPTEELELSGTMKLSGDVVFSDYEDLNDTIGKFLTIDNEGRTISKTLDQVKGLIYADPLPPYQLDPCIRPAGTLPVWSSALSTDRIYSACPSVFVGIGTSNPEHLLDVRGVTSTSLLKVGYESSSSSLINGFRYGTVNSAILRLGQFNSLNQTEYVAMKLSSSGELELNYTDEFANTTSNNVLKINSISDGRYLFLLESDGLLRARRIKIDQQVWADYVFSEHYQLMPLGKLKAFIQQKNHLPGIPTEEQVKEEGVDLAEMNALLLQKIEELTLYVIEQKEETDLLKEQLTKLQRSLVSK